MSYTTESQAAGRHILPDLVRAFAVLGIVLVNVAYFAYPGEVTYHAGGLNSSADHAAYFGVNAFFLFKAYTLFSLMFGVGRAYQMQSAERRGLKFGRRYIRRLLGLLILGVLHVTFAFIGDILIIYAVMGAILYAYKGKTVKSLVRWGVVLILLQIVFVFVSGLFFQGWETHAPDELVQTIAEIEANFPRYREIYDTGSFTDMMGQRWSEWVGYLVFAAPTQMPGILGFFVLGLASVKSGIISDPLAPIWSKARRYAFPLGITISIYAAYLMMQVEQQFSGEALFAMGFILIGSPLATFGYMGWLAKWAARPNSAFKTFIARGGTATLTAYLLQSIILSLVFTGYGLGLYSDISAAGCIAIALVTGIFTLVFVSLWRVKFARGPFEYVLRRFTYWGDNR
jgi:uncharacterized protein